MHTYAVSQYTKMMIVVVIAFYITKEFFFGLTKNQNSKDIFATLL